MTNVLSKPHRPSFDPEWAESLVGLRMKVLGCWWDVYSGTALFPGVIQSVDYEPKYINGKKSRAYFQLKIDDDPDLYGMRYDAVVKYTDE